MGTQNFKSHARYVPGFHFFTLTVIVAAFIIALILLIHAGITHTTILYILVTGSLGLLFVYIRQFATGNQDRIIRAEENFRSFRLTGKVLDARLTRTQIIALRFADDDEYAALTEKAIKQDLTPAQIKQEIQQWRADHHRV
jgi:hypothetical protein